MKAIFLIFLSMLTSAARAQTCFKADTIPSGSQLPETLCVNSYSLELVIPSLPKTPYYLAKIDSTLGDLSGVATFRSSEKAPFVVSLEKSILYDRYGVCSGFYHSMIAVDFKVDSEGKVLDGVGVRGLIHETNDECHSTYETIKVDYTKID